MEQEVKGLWVTDNGKLQARIDAIHALMQQQQQQQQPPVAPPPTSQPVPQPPPPAEGEGEKKAQSKGWRTFRALRILSRKS